MKLIISDKHHYEKYDIATQEVVRYLESIFGTHDCTCYYQYPLHRTDSGFVPSLVLIHKEYGVVVLKILNYTSDRLKKITDTYWLIDDIKQKSPTIDYDEYNHLLKSDIFRPKFKLENKVNFNSFTILPFFKHDEKIDESNNTSIIYDDYQTQNIFSKISKKQIENNDWNSLLSIIQGLDTLTKNYNFIVDEPPKNMSEAIILNERKLHLFDYEQEMAAQLILDGGMQIRGLAGTGKTIVLTWKAAYLHYKYPNLKIVYTFYTQSLYNQIKRLILRFYHKYVTSEEPNWKNLQILHAWGGYGKDGLYYNTCNKIRCPALNMKQLRFVQNPFGHAISLLIKHKLNEEYDFILVDEAQDMPLEFFNLVEKVSKSPKKVYIAYDALQSTEDTTMPNFEKLFGYFDNGKPKIPLSKEGDKILGKSYRNQMFTLHLAVALGFGIYCDKGAGQILEEADNWNAIGYNVTGGNLRPGEYVEITRPSENSPNNIYDIYPDVSPVQVFGFDTKASELNHVANEIIRLIRDEKVKPEDIMVVDIDSKNVKGDYGHIRLQLLQNNIACKIPGMVDESDDFLMENHVTLSTTRRAKGNEAPVIFILGINTLYEETDVIKNRQQRSFAFISITRSKAWCFISGNGQCMRKFFEEFDRIKADFPTFKFQFPTEERLQEIRRINYIAKDEKLTEEYFDSVRTAERLMKIDSKILPKELKEKLIKSLSKPD